MKFTATDSENNQTAFITCEENSKIKGQNDFVKRLKDAITQWTKFNEVGKQAWNDSFETFNFGDLALYCGQPELQNILAMNGITNLKVNIISYDEADLNFNTVLTNR